MNLPQTITFTGNRSIEFVYDALGAKLRKTVKAPSVADVVTDYMDGFEYKNGTLDKIYHSEGYVERKADGTFQYNYTLKDHLGNTRVTFADLNNNGTIDPNTEINQINHYYPFGLNMEGNWNGASADAKNKFQYNGKELQSDFGLNWNDYGARSYDAARGQWTAVDPLADKMQRHSPYNYCFGNPIKFTDPFGMSPQANGSNGDQIADMVNSAWNATAAGTNMHFTSKTKNIEDKDKKADKQKSNDQETITHISGSIGKGGKDASADWTVNPRFEVKNVLADGLNIIQTIYATEEGGLGRLIEVNGVKYDCWVDPDGSLFYNTKEELADPKYANLNWDKDHGEITLRDRPSGSLKHKHIVFEFSIVAINYKGSGQDKIMGSVQYGWDDNGLHPIHSGVNILPTISTSSREIVNKLHPNYKLYGEK